MRATTAVAGDNSTTTTFYTSVDGTSWTQLGTPITTGANAAGIAAPTANSFMEIGAGAWQPAYSPLVGKISHVVVRDTIDGATVAPVLPELWERYPTVATTFGGSPTLTLINASRSGADLAYHAARVARETPDYGQVLAIFNDSHNEIGKSGQRAWLTPYKAWVDAVRARLVRASVAVVIQNPHTAAWAHEAAYGVSHQMRLAELRAMAGREGWGIIDLYNAFRAADPTLSTLISADGLHPTQAGYELGGATTARLAGIVTD